MYVAVFFLRESAAGVSPKIDIADIIKAASQSPLGIAALVLVISGPLGFLFFRKESVKARKWIFVAVVLVGLFCFAMAIENAQKDSSPIYNSATTKGDKSPSVIGSGNSVSYGEGTDASPKQKRRNK